MLREMTRNRRPGIRQRQQRVMHGLCLVSVIARRRRRAMSIHQIGERVLMGGGNPRRIRRIPHRITVSIRIRSILLATTNRAHRGVHEPRPMSGARPIILILRTPAINPLDTVHVRSQIGNLSPLRARGRETARPAPPIMTRHLLQRLRRTQRCQQRQQCEDRDKDRSALAC